MLKPLIWWLVSMYRNKKVCIALTGGGTAGHVMPHLAMLPSYQKLEWEVYYIGSKGIERELVGRENIDFYQIASGKLRRYFSFENFIDIFRIGLGILQALLILIKRRPDVLFSKGGFVSVPPAIGAWILRIPVISHESDLTPGLANRIIGIFANRILYSFADTGKYLPPKKSKLSGTPIRGALFEGKRQRGLEFCGFSTAKDLKTILVMGGSLGAQRLNLALGEILPQLITQFQVVHLTGKGKGLEFEHDNYRPFEYIGEELKDVLAASDLVISRAGANSIFEFLALNKPMLLVPLEIGSRGDQLDNAAFFVKQGWSQLLREQDLNSDTLLAAIEKLGAAKDEIKKNQQQSYANNPPQIIMDTLKEMLK